MKKQHILLAGEKKENALPLSLFLESQNFCVTVEESGTGVVKRIRDHQNTTEPFDLLVTGTQMPEGFLLEILSELKRLEISLPFVMISDNDNGNLSRLSRSMGKGAGLTDVHIVKPSKPAELINVVQRILKPPGKNKTNDQ